MEELPSNGCTIINLGELIEFSKYENYYQLHIQSCSPLRSMSYLTAIHNCESQGSSMEKIYMCATVVWVR